MFKIEKNIELPSPDSKYPWADMEIGDSVFIKATDMSAARASYVRYAKRNEAAFSSRAEGEGYRVWRVAP